MLDCSKYKIMLIDDDPTFNKWLATLVKKEMNVDIIDLTNPKKALELISENPPDLILLDMEMPYMDGLTALKKIRQIPGAMNTPVIVCSAVFSRQLFISLAKLGIKEYVLKSSGSAVILEKIYKTLKSIEGCD